MLIVIKDVTKSNKMKIKEGAGEHVNAQLRPAGSEKENFSKATSKFSIVLAWARMIGPPCGAKSFSCFMRFTMNVVKFCM